MIYRQRLTFAFYIVLRFNRLSGNETYLTCCGSVSTVNSRPQNCRLYNKLFINTMVSTSSHQFPRPVLFYCLLVYNNLTWTECLDIKVYLVLTSHVVTEQTGSKRVVQELSRSERSKKRALRNQIS